MGCVLGQHDDTGRREQAIYYIEQKIDRLRVEILTIREDLSRFGLGYSTPQTLPIVLSGTASRAHGPAQVSLRKAGCFRPNC